MPIEINSVLFQLLKLIVQPCVIKVKINEVEKEYIEVKWTPDTLKQGGTEKKRLLIKITKKYDKIDEKLTMCVPGKPSEDEYKVS